MNDEFKGGFITFMGVMYYLKGVYKKMFKFGVEGVGLGGVVFLSSVELIKGFDFMFVVV